MSKHLIFDIVSAEIKRANRPGGKIDAYALVQIGKKSFETKVCKETNLNPIWNQTFSATINKETAIEVEVWEYIKGDHMMIGDGKLALSDVADSSSEGVWISIFYQKKVSGKMLLNARWSDKPDKRNEKISKKKEEEQPQPTKSNSEQHLAESQKETKVDSCIGTSDFNVRDCGMQTDIKDDKEIQVELIVPQVKKQTRDASTQCEEPKIEFAVQTDLKEDKTTQANIWEVLEEQILFGHDKKGEKPAQLPRWEPTLRSSELIQKPIVKSNLNISYSQHTNYLERKSRGSLPKIDFKNKRSASTNRIASQEEVITSRTSKPNSEDTKSFVKQRFAHVGNFLVRNNVTSYNIYDVE